jgi:hypothetical protein
MTFGCTGKVAYLSGDAGTKGPADGPGKVIPVASIREGLEIFAGGLEAVIRELPELEGQGGDLDYGRAGR